MLNSWRRKIIYKIRLQNVNMLVYKSHQHITN